MARGGARAGAGRKKGPQTLEKEAARQIVRELVYEQLGPLVKAQISNAMGISYLVVRDKQGKFVRVAKGRAEKIDPEQEIVEVWTKDPSVNAFSDLMDRALDKPKEQEQEVRVTNLDEMVGKLLAGRKRAAAARAGTR